MPNPNHRCLVYVAPTPCGHEVTVIMSNYIRFAGRSGDTKIQEANYHVELNGVPVGGEFDSYELGHDTAHHRAIRYASSLVNGILRRKPAPVPVKQDGSHLTLLRPTFWVKQASGFTGG